METHKDVLIQTLDLLTDTGRVYPTEVIKNSIKKFEQIPCVGVTRILPFYEIIAIESKMASVDTSRLSHQISNLRIVDKCLIGDVCVFATPDGVDLSKALKEGIAKFRLRSLNQYRNMAEASIVSTCQIIGIDAIVETFY